MARLKIPIEDDDDSLPELEDLLKRPGKASEKRLDGSLGTNSNRTAKNALNTSRTPRISRPSGYEVVENLKPKQKTDGKQGWNQETKSIEEDCGQFGSSEALRSSLGRNQEPSKIAESTETRYQTKGGKIGAAEDREAD